MSGISSYRQGWLARSPSLATLVLVGFCLELGGCAGTVADLPVVGLPANTPARPVVQGEYLPVHDVPPPRSEAVMTPAEVEKAEKDLIAARNRQAFGAEKPARKTPPEAAKAPQNQN